jgi:hypothetical protein
MWSEGEVFLRYAKSEKELCEKAGLLAQTIGPPAGHEIGPGSAGSQGTAVPDASPIKRRQGRVRNAYAADAPFLTCYTLKTPSVM